MTAIAFNNYCKKSNVWYLDSGATMHMSNEKEKFTKINDDQATIYIATEESVNSSGKGEINMQVNITSSSRNNIKLKEAMLVSKFKNNFLSMSQIIKNGYKVTFYKDGAKIRRQDGSVAMSARQENGLYLVEETECHSAMLQSRQDNALIKWHQRLGHLNFNDVRCMKNKEMVIGINGNIENFNLVCEICEKAKIHQLPYASSTRREKDILRLVHSDICGPFSMQSLGGTKYFVTFIDDKSRYIYIKSLKKRSDVLDAFKEYKANVEKLTEYNIKKLRTDNGKEYLSSEFNEFLKKEGISRELTVEYTPPSKTEYPKEQTGL